MKSHDYHTLGQVVQGIITIDRMQVFLSWEEIGIQEDNEEIWQSYTLNIRSCFKYPKDKEDHLIWYLNPIGTCETRLG